MAKATEVLKQVKIRNRKKHGGFNTFFLDLVKLENGDYSVRVYQTSKAKISYGVAYGVQTKKYHEDEHIKGGNTLVSVEDLGLAQDEFDKYIENRKDAVISQIRKLKLFNY